MLGEAKVIGALVEFGLAEREAAMEGMILIDLRTEVGSKKTAPDTVSLAARTVGLIIPGLSCLLQWDTMSMIVEAFKLPSIATRFGLYWFNCSMTYIDTTVSIVHSQKW